MRWWKTGCFWIVFIVCGIVVMTATDSWAAAGKPVSDAADWIRGSFFASKEDNTKQDEGLFGKQENDNETDGTGSQNEETGAFGEETKEPGEGEEIPATEGSPADTTPADATSAETVPEVTYRDPEDVVYTTVEDDYFTDALFIGDSRMVGMSEYSGLLDISTFYVSKGMTIFKLFTSEVVEVSDGRGKITIEEALTEHQFAKIYLEVGINEMGTGDLERFLNTYQEVVDHLQELQPDAIIYLQAIMKVTTERSNKGDYIHNQGIEDRNAGIAAMADNVKVYYLDVNPLVVDETGGLNPDLTQDGVHLLGRHVLIWKEFLKEHAVVLD